MRPRLRHIWAAWLTGSLLLVEAVIITASTPRPREKVCAAASTSSPVPELTTHSAPNCRARLKRFASKSTPSTRQPCARNICTVRSPISPKPVTTTHSPRVGFASRMPCRPIAASTVKAADSSETESGMRAQRFFGTQTISACLPLLATRSPNAKPSTPRPNSATSPTLQYPGASGWSSLLCTASTAATSPSARTLSRTMRTLSGCWRALSNQFALPNSTSIRSVPAETREAVV